MAVLSLASTRCNSRPLKWSAPAPPLMVSPGLAACRRSRVPPRLGVRMWPAGLTVPTSPTPNSSSSPHLASLPPVLSLTVRVQPLVVQRLRQLSRRPGEDPQWRLNRCHRPPQARPRPPHSSPSNRKQHEQTRSLVGENSEQNLAKQKRQEHLLWPLPPASPPPPPLLVEQPPNLFLSPLPLLLLRLQ